MVSAVPRAPAATIRLPRHASRGWSRVGTWLPCTDLRSVLPFYWPTRPLETPGSWSIRYRNASGVSHVAAWVACWR